MTELLLSNNSSIRVSTSHRSGTLNYLHVSEYGWTCAKQPEKAQEVRTGALNTLQQEQVAFIESTAEGQEGHFYELCSQSKSKQRKGTPLTPLDFKFHFFPWWRNPWALTALIVWRHSRVVETSARKGLKAQLKARDERLLLAEEKRRNIEAIKDRLDQGFTQYERQVGQYLRTVEHKAPGLEVVSGTILKILSELWTANNALNKVLTGRLARKSTDGD